MLYRLELVDHLERCAPVRALLYCLECLAFACALLYRLEPVEPFGFVLYHLYRLERLELVESITRTKKRAPAKASTRKFQGLFRLS